MSQDDKRFSAWIKVQAYKHDGALHREWSPAFLVEETPEYWALASKASSVTETDGRKWITRENAIFILYKRKWMNVICMFKSCGGICYYVNIASPTLMDKGYLKYIDYDLDVKLYPDMVERTLDENEYQHHIQTYGYPVDLTEAIKKSLHEVQRMIKEKEFPFVDERIRALYQLFLDQNQPIGNLPESKK